MLSAAASSVGFKKFLPKERIMRREIGLRLKQIGLLVVVALLALGPGQTWGDPGAGYSKMEQETLCKDLGLTPEQAKAFQAVGDKFDKNRQAIIADLEKKENDLVKALAAPKPDEQKIIGLVAEITQGHDQLFQTLKAQRQEEMAMLSPVQQAKFFLALKKWHEEEKEK
jgi:Spy/CpxP family protein refolding chaperone